MAINEKDLPEWARKQIAEKLAAKKREKGAEIAATAFCGSGVGRYTPATEQRKERQKNGNTKELLLIVPLAPVTKKNSQRIVRRRNRNIVLPSKAFKDYEEAAGKYLVGASKWQIDYPVEVTCLFYMPTRRRVDLTNLLEAIDDALVHYGILADDNSQIIVSHDGSRVLYDKDAPRTEIYIRRLDDGAEM